eukprot:COSAG03_NODE_338_length_8851_cov_33.536106_6_plen_52_part_00
MVHYVPPAARRNGRARAPNCIGTADGGRDGDDGSVMSTRLWVGGGARSTRR